MRNTKVSLTLPLPVLPRSRSPVRLGFSTPAVCLRPPRCQGRPHSAGTEGTTSGLNHHILLTFSSTTCDLVSQYRPRSRAAAPPCPFRFSSIRPRAAVTCSGSLDPASSALPIMTVRIVPGCSPFPATLYSLLLFPALASLPPPQSHQPSATPHGGYAFRPVRIAPSIVPSICSEPGNIHSSGSYRPSLYL